MKAKGNISKIVPLIGILMMILSVSFAQNGPRCGQGGGRWESPEERAQFQTEHMKVLLELTPDQVKQVEAINLKYAQESDAARKKMQQERQTRRDAKKAELEKIFTPEQIEKFKMMRPEHRGHKGKGRNK